LHTTKVKLAGFVYNSFYKKEPVKSLRKKNYKLIILKFLKKTINISFTQKFYLFYITSHFMFN